MPLLVFTRPARRDPEEVLAASGSVLTLIGREEKDVDAGWLEKLI